MAVKPENKLILSFLKSTLIAVVICFSFFSCKKKQNEISVSDPVAAVNSFYFNADLNFVRNTVGGYDTTVSIQGRVTKTHVVANKTLAVDNAKIICNGYQANLVNINPGNKLGTFSPFCTWSVQSAGIADFSYQDLQKFPKFNDQNWWKIDSIGLNDDLVLDVSGFSDYDYIWLHSELTGGSSISSNLEIVNYSPGLNTVTLKSFLKGLQGTYKVTVGFTNYLEEKVKGYNINSSKSIWFNFPVKAF